MCTKKGFPFRPAILPAWWLPCNANRIISGCQTKGNDVILVKKYH